MLEKRERNAMICEAVRNGATYTEVAADYGITRERVRQLCSRENIFSRGRWLTDAEEEQAERLHWKGLRPTHIAQEMGKSPQRIADFLARAGLREIGADGIEWAFWSVNEDHTLCQLYGTMSCRLLGEKLGRSKNEVIGRAFRLGLSKKSEPWRTLTIKGETRTLAEWCRHVGARRSTVYQRLANGWPSETAVFAPADQRFRNKS